MVHRPPDFVCIGEQRCGTTWLYQALRRHPDVRLPPVKSIGFFTRQSDLPAVAHMLAGEAPGEARKMRRVLRTKIRSFDQLSWFARYYFDHRGDDWYRGLFAKAGDRLTGEFCHRYAQATPAQLAAMRSSFPDLKLVFLIRDPIDRAWSGLCRYLARTGRVIGTDWELSDFRSALTAASAIQKSKYASTIRALRSEFPEEQIQIGYLEELKDDAAQFLAGISHWLGIPPLAEELLPPPTQSRTSSYSMPEAVEKWLAQELVTDISDACQLLGSPISAKWVERAERLGV
ncbi:sulfotransferase [Aurantiacibacter sp. MUD11]|uniref:sulfotransferase family protein n=1 Tax=Aurantiacibacter sp. MUD11 TaxID=3003265 RepID=UPI0022AAD46E|nr:sulfotransferase [Aurantiacibacter sp. MUD11]WAT18946.1 sulfotransferase [Aurantiacibacter sp. MUD11]